MKGAQDTFDWLYVEHGVTEHIRGFLAVVVGSPELLEENYPEFRDPEIPLEQALQAVVAHGSAIAAGAGSDDKPGLLARTIIPWISYLRAGGYHPLPVSALHYLLEETSIPFCSDEVDTIVARAEISYAVEQQNE